MITRASSIRKIERDAITVWSLGFEMVRAAPGSQRKGPYYTVAHTTPYAKRGPQAEKVTSPSASASSPGARAAARAGPEPSGAESPWDWPETAVLGG